MLKVYNQQMQPVAILENAFGVSVERKVNEVWRGTFSLPIDDPKNVECKHFNFVEFIGKTGRNYGKYRINPVATKKHDSYITYSCLHAISSLLDDVLEGFNQYSNVTTTQVLQSLLNKQTVKHWVLGEVDFVRYFEYGFSNENGLLAPVFSVPQPFNTPYEFVYETDVYPFVLNLKAASDEVKAEFRWGKDMISFEEVSDPSEIVNYIIPKGAGEGINQLNIKSVNGGLNYLKDQASIDQWGKRSYIWIDRRFQNADSLKANAQALLDEWKQPKISFTTKAADLSVLPQYAGQEKILNGVTRIKVEDKTYHGRIISEKIPDILEKEFDVEYEIGNKLDDIATVMADMERRQQVNEAYSQGSTTAETRTYADNCDDNFPAIIEFPIDEDCINVNKVVLKYKTELFRGYTRGMASAGQVVQSVTSSSGGGHTSTVTSSSGGSSVVTSEFTSPFFFLYSSPPVALGTVPPYEEHIHAIEVTDDKLRHNHSLNLPSHTHNVSLNIAPHTHNTSINIPSHDHAVEFGIWEAPDLPSSVTIKVDGVTVPGITSLDGEIDLVPYLSTDSSGNINRDYHTVTITPNDIGRIVAHVNIQSFIQSKGDYTK
jgi:phage minor structural protein